MVEPWRAFVSAQTASDCSGLKVRALQARLRPSWGTDWPWFEHVGKYPQFVDAVRLHAGFLTGDEQNAYLGGNAIRYLGQEVTNAQKRSDDGT
jgi:hypothetical protein